MTGSAPGNLSGSSPGNRTSGPGNARPPENAGALEGARILLVNDDGLDAPGMATLEKIARAFSDDLWTVAPETESSGTGAGISMFSGIRVRRCGERTYAVRGTAADCVLLGLLNILRDSPPDLVLSGVNRGANMAEDLLMSGTVGATLVAGTLGVPAVALSQQFGDQDDSAVPGFGVAEAHAPAVLAGLAGAGWPKDTVFNVNFPAVAPEKVAGVAPARQGRRGGGFDLPRTDDPRRDNHFYFFIGGSAQPREGAPGTDLDALERDCIAITPLACALTAEGPLERLRDTFPQQLRKIERKQAERGQAEQAER